MTSPVITISASFGAGGSVVGPAVAERLQLPFIDRAIPAAVAHSLAVPLGRALAHDDRAGTGIGRLIAKMAAAVVPMGAMPTMSAEHAEDEDVFRTRTEQVIRQLADERGAVVLGRAAAIVLAGHPRAFHVRLDGPREARLARIQAQGEVGPERAAQTLDESDRAREAYVRHFYRADPNDARLYHLTIDSTAIPLDTCTEIIMTAARARIGQRPGAHPAGAGREASAVEQP